MPYADNGNVRIHYQVEGEGPALVLQHGFTESVVDWYEAGYVEALRPDYRLILIDARGHGASDKPHDPGAYVLNRRVADVVAVLDALDIAKALFWGYSMGGWTGFGIAKYAKERVHALVIGGQHPYARGMGALQRMVQRGIAQGSGAFVASMEEMFGPESAERKERLLSADLKAYLALAQDRPGLDDILLTMLMPCCLYAGDRSNLPRGRSVQPTHTTGDLLIARPEPPRGLRAVNLCCLASPDLQSAEYIVRRTRQSPGRATFQA
jgi:pimeloyl-ACP methyl ester carboxylesterase